MKVPVKIFPDDFRAGMVGFGDGLSVDDCPYKHDGKNKPDYEAGKRQAWMAGWLEAQYFDKYWRRKSEVSE